MHCIYCQYPESKVIRTTHSDDNKHVYRRRECLRCAMRYTTAEHLRDSKKPILIPEKSKRW